MWSSEGPYWSTVRIISCMEQVRESFGYRLDWRSYFKLDTSEYRSAGLILLKHRGAVL